LLLALALCLVAGSQLHAQDVAAEIGRGDRAHAALDAPAAFAHYSRAASFDASSYEAAWKASRSAADLEARSRDDRRRRLELLGHAQSHARRAVALRPDDAEGHFSLARALGLAARSVGIRERVRYATEVRNHALECLRIAPQHAGCMHVIGAWNAEVMRLSGVERFIARQFLGARALGRASWADAVRHLEAAVAAEPWRIAHRVELAEIYGDLGRRSAMLEQYEIALRLESRDYGDPALKAQARAALEP
jgi:tetratricopeptide (TPR) repeat protein